MKRTIWIVVGLVVVLVVGAAIADFVSAPDHPDGPVLKYRIDVGDALDQQLEARGDRLLHELEDWNPRGDIEMTRPSGEDYLIVTFTDESDLTFVDDAVGSITGLEITESDGLERRVELPRHAAAQLRDPARTEFILESRTRLEEIGFDRLRIARMGSDAVVIALPEVDDEQLERAKEVIGILPPVRLMVVDERNDEFFREFEQELPPEFGTGELRSRYPTFTHPDVDELREFFDGRVPDDALVGYEHHYVESDERSEGPTSDSAFVDEERLEGDELSAQSHWTSILLDKDSALDGRHLRDVRAEADELQYPYVALHFDDRGTQKLEKLTTDHVDGLMAVVIGDEIQSLAPINESVEKGGIWLGVEGESVVEEARQEAREIGEALQVHSAPISFEIEEVVRDHDES